MENLKPTSEKKKSQDVNTISDYSFSDLLNISDLQQLVNHLSELAGCPIGILDIDNTILASAGWQKICTCFHRIHHEMKLNCIESDNFIKKNLETKSPISYKCKNGLMDVAYPIVIEGKHLANIFFGQFFYDDEKVDKHYFELQAEKYGFDKTEYLNALYEVPVISRKKEEILKSFSITLAQMLAKTGYSNLLLKKEKIEELRLASQQIKESELKFRKVFEQAGVGVTQVEVPTGRFLKINKKFAEMVGYSMEELLQMAFQDITHPDDLEENLQQVNQLLKKQITEFSTEKRYIRKDGTIMWAILTVSAMNEIDGEIKNNIVIVQDITERKKSELNLLESEIKFRKFFELSGVGVAQVDVSTGKFINVNNKLADMLGYSIDEILQLTFQEVTYPDDLKESLQNQIRLIKKQIGEFSIEKRYRRKDGTVLCAVLTASSMGEMPGGSNYQIAIIQDITERKKSEQKVLESEEKFKTIFDQSPVGLALFDTDGKLLDCNPACLSMVGIDNMNEIIGVNLFEDPNITEQQKKDIKKGNNVRFEIKFDFDLIKKLNLYSTKRSGNYFFSCFSTLFKTEGNNKTGILIHLIDITQRKKAEETLKEENDRFHTSMNAMDSIVYVADMENHQILFANKYVKDLFGDIVGKKCYSALQGKTTPCDFCTNHLLIDAMGNANPPYVWEFQNLITRKWYQCHDQAIQWTNGKLVRFEMATDITVNKENEKMLKENEIKLQELNSTKDKFFSIIGHDLKNPFTVLKSSSELLSVYLEKNDLAKSKAKAAMISNASNHGYALLENLLVWAKSQTGGLRFEPQKLNFKNSVSETIKEIEDHALEKNIAIINEIPEDLILLADENLLSVVFRNLITNAIKFTHSGGSITITAISDKDNVEVAVIDTGIGIPKEHQYKLFRLDVNFSRVGTANEASTSLGLILCKEFIEKHKGKIWVESDTNKGSEFRFTIPHIQKENNP